MVLSILVLAGLSACATQKEPPPPASTPKAEAPPRLARGVVHGTVTDARSGEALGYASVRVRQEFEIDSPRAAMTGIDGGFRIGGLALGQVSCTDT